MKIKDLMIEQTMTSTPSQPPEGQPTPPSEETTSQDLSKQYYQLLNQIRLLDYDNSVALLNLLT